MLISTKPDSKGKAAALFRCRQLTEVVWTPVRDIPVYTKKTGKTVLPAGNPQRGMLYSSTEPNDKFVTENVSFETFLSAVANPHSALYTKDLGGHNNSWAYFGIVCNGFVRYALNIRRRFSTKRWAAVPGMHKIADEGCYKAEQIALCDVLHAHGNGRNHVALITDILRDEQGRICQIEVSEAVRPVCKRVRYNVEKYFEKYSLFALWRYDRVDTVPMPDPQEDAWLRRGVPGLPAVAVDYGNKSNYHSYENVVISVFSEGRVWLLREGVTVESIDFCGPGCVTRRLDRGYYILRHSNGESTEFCVCAPKVSGSVQDGRLSVRVDACDPESKILYMEFREMTRSERQKKRKKDVQSEPAVYYSKDCASLSRVEELTDEEKTSGCFTRDIPEDAYNFKVYFENRYGIWTHIMIPIER